MTDLKQTIAELEKRLQVSLAECDELLHQRAATNEVLQVINASSGDLAPVFDAILERAMRLCEAKFGLLATCDGGQIRTVATRGVPPAFAEFRKINPPDYGPGTGPARILAGERVVHIVDLKSGDAYRAGDPNRRVVVDLGGARTVLLVPLLKNKSVLGYITIYRKEVRPYSDKQIVLLQNFADQAMIAIENARLFKEAQDGTAEVTEALERQTATSEILRVISQSPTDVQPVFDAIVQTAVRLIRCDIAFVLRCDGATFSPAAAAGPDGPLPDLGPSHLPIDPGANFPSRAIVGKENVHLPDWSLIDLPEHERQMQALIGVNSALFLPLLREAECIGVLALAGKQANIFGKSEIALAESFRDQALIAIENVRLFNETRDVLARQTATAEVLQVISSSPGDLKPVFDQMLAKAMRLCEAQCGFIYQMEQGAMRAVAEIGVPPAFAEYRRDNLHTGGAATPADMMRATRKPAHVHDARDSEPYRNGNLNAVAGVELGGARTVLYVPMIRNDDIVGVINVYRQEVRPFTEEQISLLENFASQAVIAIENARLFNETKEALERQTATAEVLKIIAASPTDVQPVFEAIVETTVRLLGCETSFIQRCNRRSFWSVARCRKEGLVPVLNPRPGPIDPTANFPSRAILAKTTLYLPDWSEIELPEFERRIQQELGYNSAIYLPLLYKDECLGVLGIAGSRPRMFSDGDIALAEAFRDQAVIAIRNTQLFEEVQQRTHELSQSLEDLRTAQDRLVQTEKLASLGQLTAGIAHEIKNPLNFVNNFSALSVELTDELRDVLKQETLTDKGRSELDELTGLLHDNLGKVVQHGKRADSIVKNMLLHSREGSGERRSADVNALVGESLNLAYHGARAEKLGFAITLKHDLDPDAGALELYPQEITRALLNLISNGFYAATKRKSENSDGDFEPVLSAATRNLGETVEIRIRDNGTGIPPDVREKMFNPFFTTKPTGEGTGLGLSMTHDIIVKQHGGRIDVETEPGVFTEFIITLPREKGPATKRE